MLDNILEYLMVLTKIVFSGCLNVAVTCEVPNVCNICAVKMQVRTKRMPYDMRRKLLHDARLSLQVFEETRHIFSFELARRIAGRHEYPWAIIDSSGEIFVDPETAPGGQEDSS